MKRLRKKLLAGLATVFLIVVAVYLVGSVTRSISDVQDNKETFIRNSNGNYWEPVGDNVQEAIEDLDGEGGVVWVGSDITISEPIEPRSHVILDFLNHKVTLEDDVYFVHLEYCDYVVVRNARVYPTSNQTASIIHLYNAPGEPYAASQWHNTFENIEIRNTGTVIPASQSPTPCWYFQDQYFAGIHLELHSATMLSNKFRNIVINGPKTGIWLERSAGWSNGNVFENIYVDQYERCIWFDALPYGENGFSQTIFQNVKSQTGFHSKYGILNVSRNGNHFDHVLMWDWGDSCSPNTIQEWSIRGDAWATYVNAHFIQEMDDQGIDTLIVCPCYPNC